MKDDATKPLAMLAVIASKCARKYGTPKFGVRAITLPPPRCDCPKSGTWVMNDGSEGDSGRAADFLKKLKKSNPECMTIALFTRHPMRGDPRWNDNPIGGKNLGSGVMISGKDAQPSTLAHELGHLGHYWNADTNDIHSSAPNNVMAPVRGRA